MSTKADTQITESLSVRVDYGAEPKALTTFTFEAVVYTPTGSAHHYIKERLTPAQVRALMAELEKGLEP
jgi:hypothetical protein